MNDEQAMWRVKMQEDPEAFALLVARWEQPIRRLCTRMTGDAHRGQDLAQEAFTRVFMRRKQYDSSGRFSTFLWRVALNLCYDEFRRTQRRSECPLDPDGAGVEPWLDQLADPQPAPDAWLEADERAEAVRKALLQLAEPYRVVLVLRHYEGLKFREISEVLGIPEGTVKSRTAEALDQVHQALVQPNAWPAPRSKPKELML